MPRYGDDQCANCGGVRVAKSTLCADCLVKENDRQEKEILIQTVRDEMKKKCIINLQALLKEAMAYGFKKNQENVRLFDHIKGLELKIREVMDDEANRQGEDKEG